MSKLLALLFLLRFFSSDVFASVQTPKKGVAGIDYNGIAREVTPPEYKALGISWFYSWHAEMHGFNIGNLSCTQFVPMIRSTYTDVASDIFSKIDTVITTNNKKGLYWLIGNESDMTATSDSDGFRRTDVTTSLDNYVTYAQKIKTLDPTAKLIVGGFVTISDIRIGSITTPPALNMARILKDKLIAKGITPTGWHIHLYNCCNVEDFKLALSTWKDWQNRVLGGGETWITEFGSLENRSGMDTFMRQTVNLIETTTDNNYKVDRYAWFQTPESSAFPGGLFDSSHQITYLGSIYANLPTNGPQQTTCQPSLSPIPTPTPTPTPQTISTQKGWNKISLTTSTNNILTDCTVSSKRGNYWKTFKTNFDPGKPYYAKCN